MPSTLSALVSEPDVLFRRGPGAGLHQRYSWSSGAWGRDGMGVGHRSAGGGGSEALRTELNSTDSEHIWFMARREPEKGNLKSLVLEACMCAC